MGEIDPAVIKKTQETLGKIINKPQLTDALLAKPPFRFLHDIIKAVSILLQVAFFKYIIVKNIGSFVLINEFVAYFYKCEL
jgi:hypothetical protein